MQRDADNMGDDFDNAAMDEDWEEEGGDDWGGGNAGGAAGGASGGDAMELSEEAQMQNLLAEAEDEGADNPAKALPLFLSYLTKCDAAIKALEDAGEGGGTEALDLKLSRRKAVTSTVALHCKLREVLGITRARVY